jgi:hypothetical protein
MELKGIGKCHQVPQDKRQGEQGGHHGEATDKQEQQANLGREESS